MNLNSKIEHLASLCKEDVIIWINNYHRGGGETIRSHIREFKYSVDESVIKEMETKNIIVTVQAYPNSQVGFYTYSHYDVEFAVDEMIKIITEDS